MADLTFKDLSIDTNQPDLVAPFWAAQLGLTAERQDNGDYALTGHAPVWVSAVPEPLTVKNRVHLDLRYPEGTLPDATVLREQDDELHWTVMADPDGLVFCAFGPHPLAPDAPGGPFELVVDAADPLRLATWWAARTGGEVHQRESHAWIEGAAGFPYRYWVFAPVPEPKTVKNRVHWDVTLTDCSLDDLVSYGATVLRAQDDEIGWTVLADPEGNEFCAFAARK